MSAPAEPGDGRVAQAVAELRRLIPAGSNRAILAAMAVLAEHGDAPALAAVEAHLGTAALSEDYGDRDSDPSPWHLDAGVYPLLARWWERLGVVGERAAWLAADWLDGRPYAERHFRSNSYEVFTRVAPLVAAQLAPMLIPAAAAGAQERRVRAASGLQYTPSDTGLDALVALLGDPADPVAEAARGALSMLAHPRSPGSTRVTPAAPEAVAARLLDALDSPAPAVRRRALAALAWFAGAQHRSSVALPPLFARVFPAVARRLSDPDPAVRQMAAKRIVAAGPDLDRMRLSQSAALAPALRLPDLDLLPLLDHADRDVSLAAVYLAGRTDVADAPPGEHAVAARIHGMLGGLRGDWLRYTAALYALGRLQHSPATAAIAGHLEDPRDPLRVHALLALARLRHSPAIAPLVQLLRDLTYRQDAREALELFDPAAVLPLVKEQVRASARDPQAFVQAGIWEVSYLEAHGDAEALALLRQTESYHFAARYIGAEREGTVAAARRLERRLLLAAGLDELTIDDPAAAVQRILAGPLHPAERDTRGAHAPADYPELRARWRNLCVALDAWLLAEEPRLGQALDAAIALLAGFPDEVREAHERWWLDVTRGGQLGLPRVSAVARAQLHERAPWRLARALVVNEGIAAALDPAAALAWPGLRQIAALSVDHAGWLGALARAPADFAPKVLRCGVYDDRVAEALLAWHGLARLERLEIAWSIRLGDAARAALHARTLAARRGLAWRTAEGTLLVLRDAAPVHDSFGGWIARADGTMLAAGATYEELTGAGETVRVYGGPLRYFSPEETMISQIYDVVGGALHQYVWYEGDRPAPGELDDTVVRDGLVPEPPAQHRREAR